MPDDELQTQVDDLLNLLKHQEKMALEDAAEELGVELDVVQQWVDFLVEERMVGIEYKFTKPYIYLNEPDETPEDTEEEPVSYDEIRDAYLRQAEEKEIPEENRKALWKQHVSKVLSEKEEYFKEEANKRGLTQPDKLWDQYQEELLDNGP